MKKSILLICTFIHLTVLNAQNTGIAKIKEYYHSINKNYMNMKKVLILLFMFTAYNKVYSQLPQKQIIDGDVYIYEFAIKRPGRANLGFIIVDSNSYQDISFDVYFSKGKINKVNRTISPVYSENNVADKLGNFYYSSDDFIKKRRLIPDNIYKMIDSSFLEMTNKERLKILNKLSK